MRRMIDDSPTWVAIALLTVLTFGAGLLGLCLPDDEAGGPAYYDGDGDDVGIVQERGRAPIASDALLQSPGPVPSPLVSHPVVVGAARAARPARPPGDRTARAPPA